MASANWTEMGVLVSALALLAGSVAMAWRWSVKKFKEGVDNVFRVVVESDIKPQLTSINARLDEHDRNIAELQGYTRGIKDSLDKKG